MTWRAPNYSFEAGRKGGLTIDQAALEEIADDKLKTYGRPNPELTFSVDGLVTRDTKASALTRAPALSTVADSAGAGTHTITITGGPATTTR